MKTYGIDNLLRTALNSVWVSLKDEGISNVTLELAKQNLIEHVRLVGSWPDSPDPEAFPFVQRSAEGQPE